MTASRSESETRVAEVGIWVRHEDVIRERLLFDLAQIRTITNHMPRDVAEGYEASVTTALTSLDALVAVARTYRQPTPCNCRDECMDADDEEGTCKGLPMPPKEPLVEIVLTRRAALSPFPPTPEQENASES